MKKLAHIVGAVILLGAICPGAIALLITAAVGFRAAHGAGSVEGAPWRELLLGVLPLAPAIVLALGTRGAITRPGVGACSALVAAGLGVLTFAYFARLAPVLAGPVGADGGASAGADTVRLAACVVPLLLGVAIALRSRRDVRTQIVACAALATSVAAIALALPRFGQPPPSRYLSTLEPAVEIEGDRAFHLAGGEYRIERVEPAPIPVPQYGYFLPSKAGCVLRGPHGSIALGNLLYDSSDCRIGWDSSMSSPRVNTRSAIYVDPRGDYAVLFQPELTGPYMERTFARPEPHSAPRLCDGCGTYAMAIRTRDGAHVALDAQTLRGRLSAPSAMILVATLGAAAALALVRLAARSRRRGRIPGGRDAFHEGGGAVRLGDTVSCVEAAAGLPIGPVVIAGSVTDGRATPFRDGVRFERAVEGTAASIREAVAEHASTKELAAFAIALVTAASLIGAHAAGL